MSGLHAERSKMGCWTCRERKIKCDESRPKCKRCLPRNRPCQYGPRPRARRRHAAQSNESLSVSRKVAIPKAPVEAEAETEAEIQTRSEVDSIRGGSLRLSSFSNSSSPKELPYGIQDSDWPLSLTDTDRRALQHYVGTIIPRMVLKTARWSSYSYVLFMCLKHRLLAHLLLSFSIRDMAENHETDLITAALEHHQEALNLFISHLATPNAHSWVTFPALWFFILYEQTYGEDPRVMEAHLRGVRDVIASHGRTILASSLIDDGSSSGGSEERFRVPPKMINRIALWTIHQDAKASTFGLGGSMIDLLNEEYPDSIDRIFEDSSTALQDAWGLMYPAVEDLWDRQAHEMFRLVHENTMLRYKLAKIEKEDYEDDEKEKTSRKIMQFCRDLKLLEKKFLPFMEPALSRSIGRSPLLSNTCVVVAEFLALVVQYERLAYDVQSLSLPKLLQVCASLYEYEGPNFLRHVAWALLVAGFETEDSVYQSWIIERFAQLQKSGNNMRQAMILLQAVFLEKRTSTKPIRYNEWLNDDRFKKFSI